VTPTPAPVEVAVETVAPTKVVKPMRSPDSDDHLAAYFRQLAEHELLTPEDERELSQGIEDTEILTWERVFSRADVVRPLLAAIEPNLEQPSKLAPKLLKVAEETLKAKKGDKKAAKKMKDAAKEAAVEMRSLDLDRVHIDAIFASSTAHAAARSPTRRRGGRKVHRRKPARMSTKSVRRIAMQRICATSSCGRTCVSSSRWLVATTVAACRSPI